MAQQTLVVGTTAGDGTGEGLRSGMVKVNANFGELYALASSVASNPRAGSYTLVLSDAGKSIDITSASATTCTIPLDSSVAFAVGTVVEVARLGAGSVTLTFTGGITVINPYGSLILRAQGSTCSLRKTATNTWLVSGDFQ